MLMISIDHNSNLVYKEPNHNKVFINKIKNRGLIERTKKT